MATTLLKVLLLLVTAPTCLFQASNNQVPLASNNQPIQPGTYYMDSNADCNGPVREIYSQTVRVLGAGTIQEQQPPESCSILLRSTSALEQTQLRIQVVAATIRDCDVRVTIYDGDPGQNTLRGFDCNSPVKPNERDYITTGDLVSFTLSRRDSVNTLFDIEFLVTPLITGNKPGYENDFGDSWGTFREKLENDAAVGIVGAVFAVTIILVIIGMVCCHRRHLGKNKPWEQHQLSSFQPATSVYETKSRMSDTSSGVWASNVSRSQPHSAPRHRVEPHRHMARPSEDEDSVFDDDVPPKKHLMERERRWQRERERERERDGHRGRSREFASHNTSYVQADDDHPQDTFVERVITPRVRPKSRNSKPPPYEEALEESETEKSEIEDEEESDDDVDHKESSEEEEESEESEEPSSEEEEEVKGAKGGKARPKAAPRPKQLPPQPPTAVPLQPGMPNPGLPHPGIPYPMGYPVPPGQFVPVMGPPPGQFVPIGPGYPPPRYQGPPQPPAPQSNVQPTDIPIYSYLVQRGYTPLDGGRDSPISMANTSHSHASADDSDKNILSPGVEYMRR